MKFVRCHFSDEFLELLKLDVPASVTIYHIINSLKLYFNRFLIRFIMLPENVSNLVFYLAIILAN